MRKLLDCDIPNHMLRWIVDFLSNRRQRVKLAEDCFSEWRYIPAGVPPITISVVIVIVGHDSYILDI